MSNSSGTSRLSQDAAGGVFLVALAAVALWQGADLEVGTLREIGPGMLPRALALCTGLCGILIAARSWWRRAPAEPLSGWSIRGTLFIVGAALAFALAIRPLGFTAAGPAAIVLGALASRETRPVEIAVFAVVMTALCTVLFRYLLGLPIPVAPWLLGY